MTTGGMTTTESNNEEEDEQHKLLMIPESCVDQHSDSESEEDDEDEDSDAQDDLLDANGEEIKQSLDSNILEKKKPGRGTQADNIVVVNGITVDLEKITD
jgi:hypothetical protein